MRRGIRSCFLVAIGLLVTTAVRADDLLICSFNVYRLGAVDPKYENLQDADDEEIPERVQNLANVLATLDFDLICLQEVHAGERGHAVVGDLVHALDNLHDRRYRYVLSEAIGAGFNMTEAIAFLYNPDSIHPKEVRSDGALTDRIPIAGRDLVRSAWASGNFEFTMIAAHLAWGNADDRDAGYKAVEDILTGVTRVGDDPDVLVLGDFNRFGDNQNSVEHLDHDPGEFFVPNVQFFDPDVHEIERVTVASITGKGVPGDNPQRLSTTVAGNRYVYDMVLFTPDAAEEYVAGQTPGTLGEDFGIVYFDEAGWPGHQTGAEHLSHNDLKHAYSDHRPLWVRFRTDGAHADASGSDPLDLEVARFVGTEHGSRFHLRDCRTIRNSTLTRFWFEANDAEVERGACRVCRPLDQ